MNINKAILHVFDFVSCVNVFAQTEMDLGNKTAKRYVTSQAKRAVGNRGAYPADRRVFRGRVVAYGEDPLHRPAHHRLRRRPGPNGARDDRRGGRGRLQGPRHAVLRHHIAGGPSGLHARSGLQRFRRCGHYHRAAPCHSAESVPESGVVRAHRRRCHDRVVRGQGARDCRREALAHSRRPAAVLHGGLEQGSARGRDHRG